MDTLTQSHFQTERMSLNEYKENANSIQYFDNGLSDSSDEDDYPINNLTHINKVQPSTARPPDFFNRGTEYGYGNNKKVLTNKGTVTDSAFLHNCTVDGDSSSEEDDEPINTLTYINNVQPSAMRGPTVFSNGLENQSSSSDEDSDPKNTLTFVNNIRPVTSETVRNHAFFSNGIENKKTTDRNHSQIIHGGIGAYSEEQNDTNNVLRFPPNGMNGSYSQSTVSTLSSTSYFDNGFDEESDEEKDIPLTFNNDLKYTKQRPMDYSKTRRYPNDISGRTRKVQPENHTVGVYFNNGSDDDDDDNYTQLLTCKNKFKPQTPQSDILVPPRKVYDEDDQQNILDDKEIIDSGACLDNREDIPQPLQRDAVVLSKKGNDEEQENIQDDEKAITINNSDCSTYRENISWNDYKDEKQQENDNNGSDNDNDETVNNFDRSADRENISLNEDECSNRLCNFDQNNSKNSVPYDDRNEENQHENSNNDSDDDDHNENDYTKLLTWKNKFNPQPPQPDSSVYEEKENMQDDVLSFRNKEIPAKEKPTNEVQTPILLNTPTETFSEVKLDGNRYDQVNIKDEKLQIRHDDNPTGSSNLFRSIFDQKGLRPTGQNVFEVRLKANNFNKSGNVNSPLGNNGHHSQSHTEDTADPDLSLRKLKEQYIGDDIEIDGEKSHTFKENLTKRWDPCTEKPTRRQENDEHNNITKRTTKERKMSGFSRQSSLGAYGHTCSGCGRKDCDGNFMRLLREMIKTGRSKGFEIRNVVPDGNCMFAAVIDQLELLRDYSISPFALRQSCTQFLKSNPTSEDGTPFCLFLDNETWEDYLSRMGQEGQWGDHLMLQAIASVTNRTITIINGDDENKWTSINPSFKDSTKPEPLYLGHVGELHYVSMRPIIEKGMEMADDELNSIDLYSMMPSLPNIKDMGQQQMFKEDYIDPWSDIPAIHLTFLIKQFVPLKSTIKNADSMCHQAFAIESSTDDFMDQKGGNGNAFQIKAIGDLVEGLFAASLDDRGQPEVQFSGEWADVGIICSLTTCIAYPHNMENTGTIDQSDVTVDVTHTHPGYARLLARYPDIWGLDTKSEGAMTYYIPNTHQKFEDSDVTKRFKDQYANQNPAIVYLFQKTFSAIFSPFWPEEATAWRSRSRDAGWPSPGLIDSIVSEGVYYISHPHVNSSNPGIEFQICFAVAERRLANEGLSKEQRYCFIVFKALISHALMGDELINSTHLKSVFFYVCEQIPQQYWSSRVSGCILYMVDSLIRQLEMGILPNYFISSNNMIDHLSHDQIQNVLEKLKNLQTNPVSSLYSIAYQNMVTNADEIFQEIRYDIDDFHEHKSVRQSVIGTLVPAKIKQAAKYIEVNNLDMAIEIIQEAHEDRLLVSTCEDNIPFVAFVTEVTNSFGLTKQWWLCLHADETLGTALAVDLSLQHNPIPLKEIVGTDIADRYGELLIPRPLAENLCTFCFDFYLYLTVKHRKKKAVSFLVKAREFLMQLQNFGALSEDFPCTINTDDFNIANIYQIYKCLVQNFVMTMSSEPLCNFRLDEVAHEVQSICEGVNTEEAYTILVLMWKYLGNTEKCNEASAKLEYFTAGTPSNQQCQQ